MATTNELLNQARAWLGKKESDGSHKEIIDIYNTHKPLARGYKVKYTDNWCATFISALAIKCNATNIIPLECGCEEMIKLAKTMGIWEENGNIIPKVGDIIMYDWQRKDSWADHVGIVEAVHGNCITVIEGNKSDQVAKRDVIVGTDVIRGYIKPKYDTLIENPTIPQKKPQSKPRPPVVDNWVEQLNTEIKRQGFKTYPVVRKGAKGGITKLIQERLNSVGFNISVDGIFGEKTKNAVKVFQKNRGLTQDGIVGKNTWEYLLSGVKY